ncbi:hypothetical protein PCH70_47350 [Pseudomonas cichorii JBC1]|nr:hypothetical protein PCH70_47350 [Pseudomonas cichorii JBC1]
MTQSCSRWTQQGEYLLLGIGVNIWSSGIVPLSSEQCIQQD